MHLWVPLNKGDAPSDTYETTLGIRAAGGAEAVLMSHVSLGAPEKKQRPQ